MLDTHHINISTLLIVLLFVLYNDDVKIDSIIYLASFVADIHQIIIGIIVHIIVILERERKLCKTNFD